MQAPATTLLHAALALHDAGCAVVPARADGTKAPAGLWKNHQNERPEREHVAAWLTSGEFDGFGIITGAVSGQLEMLELEGRATKVGLGAELAELADNSGLGDLWATVTNGYFEITPSGGFHILYRVIDAPANRNTKLARRPATDDELAANPDEKIKVLIETRGEGGFTICAPSGGRTHPDGGEWMLAKGSPHTIADITADERDALYALAQAFDRIPTPPAVDPLPRQRDDNSTGTRPGDDYNARTSWSDILLPLGWTLVYIHAGIHYWRRPGKTVGVSATTGRDTTNGPADNLYVFTTSTSFDAEIPYSKFAAYTHLHHGGDYNAAAKTLGAQGYGTTSEPVINLSDQRFTPPDIPAPGDGNLATVHQLTPRPEPAAANVSTLERSDDGNALRLIDTYGDQMRYCADRGRWLHWDGKRWEWQPSSGGQIRELAKTVARDLPDGDKESLAHKRKSLNALGVTNMLIQAATDTRIVVSIDDLDANPWELNTPAGVVDLRTGQTHPARPEQLHTRITSSSPNPDATTDRWSNFLHDTFAGDTQLIAYLQRLVGYSAVGLVGAHVLPFCFGSGGNGKGVFLEACAKVLGDYATSAPVGFLMGGGYASHETEIASLAGARMVICSEVNEGDIFDEAKVKLLTGGDTIKARFMRQDHFTFTPSHQLWLMGNSQPAVRTGGESFWRRLRLIPFTATVPADKRVDDLQGILAREHGDAILAWIVAGATKYAADGLNDPPTVRTATAGYAQDQDTVARFLDDACILGGGTHVKLKVAAFREAYEAWCRSEGEQPVSAKALTQALARREIDSEKGAKGARFYLGISLLSTGDDDETSATPSATPATQMPPGGGSSW